MRSAYLLALGTMAWTGCALLDDAISNVGEKEFDAPLLNEVPTDGNEVAPISFEFELSEDKPSYRIPGSINTDAWSAFLGFDAADVADGEDSAFTLEIRDLDFTGDGEVFFDVAVETRSGYIIGDEELDPEPEDVASCSFSLDPDSATGDDFASKLHTCILDWMIANGVPEEFDMVVASAGAAATGSRATSWSMSGTQYMETNRPTSSGCKRKDGLRAEGLYDFLLVDAAIEVKGASEHGAAVDAYVLIYRGSYPGAFIQISTGEFEQRVEGMHGYFVTTDVKAKYSESEILGAVPDGYESYTWETNTTGISLSPNDPGEFVVESVYALAGLDRLGGRPQQGGFGWACWKNINDDTPNSGFISWSIGGTLKPR